MTHPSSAASNRGKCDTLTELLGASIQHGPLNRRIYLMSQNDAPSEPLIHEMHALVEKMGYTKVFAKIKAKQLDSFLAAGYAVEAAVPRFYCGNDDAVFVCKYFSAIRSHDPELSVVTENVDAARAAAGMSRSPSRTPDNSAIRPCTPTDAPAMAALYAQVFASYPFPIDDPAYIRETMETHVRYFCVEHEGNIVALSSAEIDASSNTAEMTDFATDPGYRGRGAAGRLLATMEGDMQRYGAQTLYTIARGKSRPVNRLFGAAGYEFGGILVNNTNIGGGIESMTVWHKFLG